ncbi:beta-1,4-galactosyltransferase 4 isoform X2 [Penaeus vannamei]|uniref:beta-1,4-galactosyltransferase 4 isoform X2 n=1 Tax=Penaeus vannamei TaxID=6689 RepID=UPI00387F56C2
MHKLFPMLCMLVLVTLIFLAAVRVVVNFPEAVVGSSPRSLGSKLRPDVREERRDPSLKPGLGQERPGDFLKSDSSLESPDAFLKSDLNQGSRDLVLKPEISRESQSLDPPLEPGDHESQVSSPKPETSRENEDPLTSPPTNQESPTQDPLLKPNLSLESQDLLRKPDQAPDSPNPLSSSKTTALPPCPEMPLVPGRRRTINSVITVEEAQRAIKGVRAGGSWWPPLCAPRQRLAVIVAFRDRAAMLGPFLYRMHPFLQQQSMNYSIYLVEQTPEGGFNQAKMYNVGFVRARAEGPWDCFVFHDVDCLPENDNNLYFCADQPRHLGVARSKTGYQLVHNNKYMGCANALTGWQVDRVNGWSNRYFGWGGEDNDMSRRIRASGMGVVRMDPAVATYMMLKHPPARRNPDRREILREAVRTYKEDGLNTLNYTLVQMERRPLYTWLFVRP